MRHFRVVTICSITLALLFGAGKSIADDKPKAIKVGQPAPEITLYKLMQAPDGARSSLNAFKGQVVVLEFWATWCKGCVEAIPYMNELAAKFADKPVRFIAITNEEEAKVLKFLEKQSITSWIGLESKGAMSRAFGVQMIPRTILIDREGKIAGMTSPEQVTEQHLNDVLAGKPVQFKPELALFLEGYIEEMNEYKKEIPENQRIFELSIQPVKPTTQPSGMGTPGDFRVEGMKLRDIIWMAYRVPRNRVQGSIPILDQAFSVRHRAMTLAQPHASRMLQETLCTVLGLSIRKEKQEVEVYVLTLPRERGPGLKLSTESDEVRGRRNGNRFQFNNCTMESMAGWLENYTKGIVLDETALKGRFDYEVIWDKDNLEESFKKLEVQLGLKMIRAKRPIEFLVVDYAPDP